MVGVLGTDGTSRSLSNLLAKVRSIQRQGYGFLHHLSQTVAAGLISLVHHSTLHVKLFTCTHSLSAYMYTGAYQYPPPTLCSNVREDIMHIEQCIGVGEIAISDSRSSCPTAQELTRLALGTNCHFQE